MTSRYRAAQRAADIVQSLIGEGMTTEEIAMELEQLGVTRQPAPTDPLAALRDNVLDIVADFADATGRRPDCVDALRARADDAEAEVAQLRAELAQARADGAAAERAAVVAWLRRFAAVCAPDAEEVVISTAASTIKRGEHLHNNTAETTP